MAKLRHNGKLQNIKDGPDPDDTGVIFRVSPINCSAAKGNPFARDGNAAMHRYYEYGIRNSFGIAIDPVTGNLWETENGETPMMRLIWKNQDLIVVGIKLWAPFPEIVV